MARTPTQFTRENKFIQKYKSGKWSRDVAAPHRIDLVGKSTRSQTQHEQQTPFPNRPLCVCVCVFGVGACYA